MRLEGLDKLKERKKAMTVGLFVVSAVLAILLLIRLAGFFTTSAWAKDLVSKAVLHGRVDDTNVEENLAKSRTLADELKKKNLFAPPTPKQNPVKFVPGILGSQAFINGKWYKEGQKVSDATLVKVEPTQVMIEWEGQEKTFLPIMSEMEGGGGTSGGSSRGRRSGPSQPVVVQGGGSQMQMPGGPSDDMRQRFTEMRDRFQNMSDQERMAFRDQMRQRFSGRGGGGDFGGRGARGGGGASGGRGGQGGGGQGGGGRGR